MQRYVFTAFTTERYATNIYSWMGGKESSPILPHPLSYGSQQHIMNENGAKRGGGAMHDEGKEKRKKRLKQSTENDAI